MANNPTQYKAIDVSSYSGLPDWKKIKESGIKIAILRAHQRYGIDSSFEHNYAGATENGILVGAYKFSYALTVEEAVKEAEDTLAVLKGRKLDCPVFYDLEWEEQYNLSFSKIEKIAVAFLDKIEAAGYSVGIYCNTDWYENKLSAKLKRYPLWLAAYPNNDTGVIVERLRPSVGIGWQYSSKGAVSGITGHEVDMDVFYTDFKGVKSPEKTEKTEPKNSSPVVAGVSAKDVLDLARSWIGKNEYDGSHKYIIDIYNSYKPLARGYAVQYNDQWCDTTISALFIKLNAVNLIGGTECGVEEHVKIFKKHGIWIEDGSIIPLVGYLIVYNWDDATQPNDGYSDHIGIVESVDPKAGTITCIEGNYKDSVGRRVIEIGWGYIRGYAAPNYDDVSAPAKEVKKEDPVVPAKETKNESSTTVAAGGLSKKPKFVGKVTASVLNVRVWAGADYSNIQSYPKLKQDNLVDICDEAYDTSGGLWYYVRIAGKFYGFVSAKHIKRA